MRKGLEMEDKVEKGGKRESRDGIWRETAKIKDRLSSYGNLIQSKLPKIYIYSRRQSKWSHRIKGARQSHMATSVNKWSFSNRIGLQLYLIVLLAYRNPQHRLLPSCPIAEDKTHITHWTWRSRAGAHMQPSPLCSITFGLEI